MRRRKKITDGPGKKADMDSRDLNGKDVIPDREDTILIDAFRKYIKGELDIEEVINDPSLKIIESEVEKMISEYNNKMVRNEEIERYIKDNLNEINEEKKILNEIDEIKLDAKTGNVNKESAGWVMEWLENRLKKSGKKPETDKRIDFITRSLAPEINEIAANTHQNEGSVRGRSLIFSFITISAAAVILLFVLIKSLLPSSDPEKLYKSYYQPFNVVSSVTRNIANNGPDGYSAAVEMYKAGDYQAAAAGFSNIMLNDTSVIAPRFLMGITQLATGKYDQAIHLLGSITNGSGEYRKEAFWYLGLAYLKTGEKENAARCFEFLSKSPGFYCERSKKLLRRLR